MSHPPRIAVLGASLGGIIAAAELKKQGCDVVVYEKGASVGGLYSKAETPFGTQELGMHVIYADMRHYTHLCDIFGKSSFHVLHGTDVDKGASANFGSVYFKSHYPCLLSHPLRKDILGEIQTIAARNSSNNVASNAEEESLQRFGATGGSDVVIPILEKLWGQKASELSRHALHCFYDLRRIVVAPKQEADLLKESQALDEVIANPDQSKPKGEVFGGRIGLVFRKNCNDLSSRAIEWAHRVGLQMKFGCQVEVCEGRLVVDKKPLKESFDACILSIPLHMLASQLHTQVDKAQLSIYYYLLNQPLGQEFPSYYILAHSPSFKTSRIVNYRSYRPKDEYSDQAVLAVEAIHAHGQAPSLKRIQDELYQILPGVQIQDAYQMPRSLSVFTPSLKNGKILDRLEQAVAEDFGKPIYFTGMRTDSGIFFSHHTIGLAYECALDCIKQLS